MQNLANQLKKYKFILGFIRFNTTSVNLFSV